jgi:hypothetical protein
MRRCLPGLVLARLRASSVLTIPEACVKAVAIADIIGGVAGRPLVSRLDSVNAIIHASIRILIWISCSEKVFQFGSVYGTAIFHTSSKTFSIPRAVGVLGSERWLVILVRLSQFLIDDILLPVTNLGALPECKSLPITMLTGV